MKLISGIILSGILVFCMGMFVKTFSEANNGDIGVIGLGNSVAIFGIVMVVIGTIIALITIKSKK